MGESGEGERGQRSPDRMVGCLLPARGCTLDNVPKKGFKINTVVVKLSITGVVGRGKMGGAPHGIVVLNDLWRHRYSSR